jgi:hypothetical protein
MALPILISKIDAGLQLRESETQSTETLRSTRVGWALTLVFGFVAVPTLADQVVIPIWKLTPFHQFVDASWTTLTSEGIAVLIVLLFLWLPLHFVSSSRT